MPGPGTTFLGGPVMTGTKAGVDVGTCVLTQQVTLNQNSTTAVSATVNLPGGSQLIDILVDPLTAWNSVTSASLTIGSAAAGTQFSAGIDVKAATARTRPTFTPTQLALMNNIGTTSQSMPVVATVTVVGATSAGQTLVTYIYTQDVQVNLGST